MQSFGVLLSRSRRDGLQASGITNPAFPTLSSTSQEDCMIVLSRSATVDYRRPRSTWHGPTKRMLQPPSLPTRSSTSPPETPRWDNPDHSKQTRRREAKTWYYRILKSVGKRLLNVIRGHKIMVNKHFSNLLRITNLHSSLDFAPFPGCFFSEASYLAHSRS